MLDYVKTTFNEPKAEKIESVQTLWSGYGEIARYQLPNAHKSIIAKHIDLTGVKQHPRGWHSEISHQRKLSSYKNEQRFYQHYAKLCNEACKVPALYATQNNHEGIFLLLEDLDHIGFEQRHSVASQAIVQLGLKWLAHFHAQFVNQNIDSLWPIGSYWHLATRPDEYAQMPHSTLKLAASGIDQKLNTAHYSTLIHGDAKLANFCFSNKAVAAVDFQYTGRGVGIKDVVYFLGSCLSSKALFENAELYYEDYFNYLAVALHGKLSASDIEALIGEWRALIVFAWADFERFLVGWSPGHQKLNEYSHQQTAKALASMPLITR